MTEWGKAMTEVNNVLAARMLRGDFKLQVREIIWSGENNYYSVTFETPQIKKGDFLQFYDFVLNEENEDGYKLKTWRDL